VRSFITFDHTPGKIRLLKIISPVTPYLAVALGLYVIGNGWITFTIYHAGLISFILLSGQGKIFKEISCGWNFRVGVISIICGSLIGPLLYFLWPLISTDPDRLSAQLKALELYGTGWIIFIIIFVAVNPILEEVFWRRFLKGNWQNKEKLPWIVDVIFAGYHLPVLAFFIKPAYLILAFAVICMGGWTWRWLSRRLDGMAVPIASHIATDISIVIAVQMIAN